ncbi:MAG: peptidase [Boseongicola sp. SB0662_bin_57]|nr:peptidase [Boseongicola sp. SB0662_bin_57]
MTASLLPPLVVNGETVPQAAIAAEAQNHPAPEGKPGFAWRKAANALAVRTLLLQEASRRGLVPEPAEVGADRFETDEEALIRQLLETVLEPDAPTAPAVRAEWERNPSRFRTPPLWEVSHILVACDSHDETSRAKAQARALELASRVRDNPQDFSRIAADSDCNSRATGGKLGQFGPGETASEFEAALRQLSEGDVTVEPVLTRHGWHIIRMDAVDEGAVLPFEAVRQKISDAMEKADWVRKARSYVQELAKSAEISGADPSVFQLQAEESGNPV